MKCRPTKHTDDEQYGQYFTDRLTIEQGEPPKLYALDLLCHNEVVAAYNDGDGVSKHIVIIPSALKLPI